MAHFAITDITTNQIKEVIVVANKDLPANGAFPQAEQAGRQMIIDWGIMPAGCTAYQCSYNASFRGCYPSRDWIYDPSIDEFVGPEGVS